MQGYSTGQSIDAETTDGRLAAWSLSHAHACDPDRGRGQKRLQGTQPLTQVGAFTVGEESKNAKRKRSQAKQSQEGLFLQDIWRIKE